MSEIRLPGAIAVLLLTAGAMFAQVEDDRVAAVIGQRVEQLQVGGELELAGARIAAVILLPQFYEARSFRAAWTSAANVEELLDAIRRSEEDGLDPEDYHLRQLERLNRAVAAADPPDLRQLADRDIVLTDALMRLAYHHLFGKVNPEQLHPDWNLTLEIRDVDPVEVFEKAITSPGLGGRIEALKPEHPIYAGVKGALARYRAIEAAGGWQPVPPGPALTQGMTDDRVVPLRLRLKATGDLGAGAPALRVFDDELERAVVRFQSRHFLTADGIAGRRTLEAMNVPVEARIDQIRVNLERARWLLHELKATEEFVITDIAAAEVGYVQKGQVTWHARAQIGRTYRATPCFKSKIKYLEFNPTWTVPPGILIRDILPAVQRDPGYLAERNIRVLDRTGNEVDPDTLDWTKYSGGGFPYILRQDPGPTNALGLVKFIFPNRHFVYLHDTPSKNLFDREDRAFSSGCIRVDKPFELAEVLLDDPEKWNQDAIRELIESGETRRVFLPRPVTVMLLYWTVRVADDGTIAFKRDVYDRDPSVLEGLEGEFRPAQRAVARRQSG